MVALASVSYVFRVFIEGAVAFIGKGGAVIFIGGAVTSIKEAVAFIGEGGSAIGKSFKITRVRIDNIKGVNKYNLK